MEQAIGECESLDGCPNGVGQIGAGFHHDGGVGRAGDVESKLIVTDAEAGAAGLNERVPRHGRKTGIGRKLSPACGARQIRGGRVLVLLEHGGIRVGSVALEKDAG